MGLCHGVPCIPGGWHPLHARLRSPPPSTFTPTALGATAAGSLREGSHCGPKAFLTSQRPLESTPEHTAFSQPPTRGASPTGTPPFHAVCEGTKAVPCPVAQTFHGDAGWTGPSADPSGTLLSADLQQTVHRCLPGWGSSSSSPAW